MIYDDSWSYDSLHATQDDWKTLRTVLDTELHTMHIEVGRYDNLHGDEDEVELTWDELEDLKAQEADLLNDQLWIEEHEEDN